jgi:hypothetical protein
VIAVTIEETAPAERRAVFHRSYRRDDLLTRALGA